MNPPDTRRTPDADPGVVCVSIRRGKHFWRFACDAEGVRELFERLADLADEGSPLSWEDAELVAAQILSNHSPDRGEPARAHDR
ncbi:MAG: hypothetical protein LAT64_07055 [Phycisphaerales bacterium]|nr:hypothetical protein [Planctomycetota bacterium]MCH8508513.1 hypothetical protein [Phycisphaerales bacterium]